VSFVAFFSFLHWILMVLRVRRPYLALFISESLLPLAHPVS